MAEKPQTPDEKLQQEFNRWAAAGEGEKMERHHLDITEKTIRLMNLRPGERVLDLGCGSGGGGRLVAPCVRSRACVSYVGVVLVCFACCLRVLLWLPHLFMLSSLLRVFLFPA